MSDSDSVFFNSPFEVGFRAVVVLAGAYPASCDLQRLVYFDYLLVNSGDVPNGPASLHPPTPFRSEEYAIRREILEQGALLMASKGIIEIRISGSGIEYVANEFTLPFLDRLRSPYAHALRSRADWLMGAFGARTNEQLAQLFASNLGKWGSEFLFMRDFSRDLSALDEDRPGDGLST